MQKCLYTRVRIELGHFENVVLTWQCASPPPQRRAAATLLAWKTEWMIDKSSGARLRCCRLHTSLACLRLCSRVQRHHPISSCSSKETRWLLDGVVYSMISIIRPVRLRLSGLHTWDEPGRLIDKGGTRKSLTRFPLPRFFAYVRVNGGISISRGSQYSPTNTSFM